MAVGLAPRPANEEQRVKAVVKTGLIDAPNPDLFQVYCDLAKDITGYGNACLLYTSPSPRDVEESRMPSSA